MHNLSEAVHKVVTRRRASNTRSRHAAVHALLAEGATITAIMQRLGMSRGTVRKYARAPTPEQLIGPNPSSGPGKLGPFKPYLRARHDDGVTDSRTLYAEIRDRGYRGTLRTLQRFLIQICGATRAPAPPPVPAARHLTAWIMRPHDRLTADDHIGLKQARARCPDLDTLTDLAHGFNHLVRERRGHHLEEWITQATACPFPEIRGFAAGLLNDFDAVRAGLTQP